MENKAIIISILTALAIGGAIGYLLTPAKIETKEVEKQVVKKVYLDKIVVKTIRPDGTIEERTEEKDRSEISETDKESTKIETNPKRIGVAVVAKSDVNKLLTIPKVGAQVNANTGFFNTFVTGSAFQDGTVTLGIGVKF